MLSKTARQVCSSGRHAASHEASTRTIMLFNHKHAVGRMLEHLIGYVEHTVHSAVWDQASVGACVPGFSNRSNPAQLH